MNNVDFTAMQCQLTPSPQARAALESRLASAAPRRRSSRWKYGLLAACIALALCAAPLVRQYVAPQHAVQSGTQDHHITYEAQSGKDSISSTFPEGTSSNTGDAPAQDGALPYEDLMAYFSAQYGPDCYPDWFAGAWLDSVSGNLVVALVESYDAAPLEQEVREAAGAAVTFSTARYSYAHLLSLQDQIDQRMQEEGTAYASWVDVMENRVRLELDTASSDLLAFLARLDPAGDAVQVTEGSAPTTDACYDTLPGAD